jgi:hypothetical protein
MAFVVWPVFVGWIAILVQLPIQPLYDVLGGRLFGGNFIVGAWRSWAAAVRSLAISSR